MVASDSFEVSYYKGNGRQRGRAFGALAQAIGRSAILFMRNCIVSAAGLVGAASLEFAVPEIADVFSGEKLFKTAAKSVEKQTLIKQLGGGRQTRSISVNIL